MYIRQMSPRRARRCCSRCYFSAAADPDTAAAAGAAVYRQFDN